MNQLGLDLLQFTTLILILLARSCIARFKHTPPSLSVLCTSDYVRVRVLLERHDFYGVIYTRPDKSSCRVLGIGEPEISLFIPLSEPGMTQCGVALLDGVYSVVIDVREHDLIEMANDISFLVQCSATGTSPTLNRQENEIQAHTALKILQNDLVVSHAVIGERYTLEMDLPNSEMFRVGSCVAFSGNDTIKFIPLMDNKGCPVEDMMTPFYSDRFQTGSVRAELKMFRFNDSTHFHIQCMINHCNTACPKVSCGKRKDANLIGARVSAGNEEEAMAAQRVVVLDKEAAAALVQYESCDYGSDKRLMGLSALLAMLTTLTAILCTFAVYNRPFRCQVLPRDGSSSDFIEFAPSLKSLSRGSLGPSTMASRRPTAQAPPIPPKMGNLTNSLKSAHSLATIPPPPAFLGKADSASRGKSEMLGTPGAASEASTLVSRHHSTQGPPSPASVASSKTSSKMSGEYFLPQAPAEKGRERGRRVPPIPPPRMGSQLSSVDGESSGKSSGSSSPSLPPPPPPRRTPPHYSPTSSNYHFPSPPPHVQQGAVGNSQPSIPQLSSNPSIRPPPYHGKHCIEQRNTADDQSDAVSLASVSSAGSGGSRVPLSKSRPSLPPAMTGRFSSSNVLVSPIRNTIGEKYTSLRNMISIVRDSAYDLYHQRAGATPVRLPHSLSRSAIDYNSTATQL